MIALKFAYLGQNYNGLEYAAGNATPQPTIEEALWAALNKGRLILPTDKQAMAAGQITWEGCDYTKCGRTDKGVSAFGQVVSLRVRSNRPLPGRRKMKRTPNGVKPNRETNHENMDEEAADVDEVESPFHPIKDEIPYVHIINRLLPLDIRILAWCSDLPEDFSARFSCRERRYRYFFTNPAFTPTPKSTGILASRTIDSRTGAARREGWLDIEAMQEAAKRYEGLHDFRNLSKLDATKQITEFKRRIYRSEIVAVDSNSDSAGYVLSKAFSETTTQASTLNNNNHVSQAPKVYQFILHGSAFLWHQVRHMMAILLLIGQGLEHPDIINKLMDPQICPLRPQYQMADDAPLVLWDCIYSNPDSTDNEDALDWIYAGDEPGADNREGKGKYGLSGLVDSLWTVWRQRKMDEILAGSLLNLAVSQGRNEDIITPARDRKTKLYLGGDSVMVKGSYIPLMQRPCCEHFEVANAKYAAKKGYTPKSAEELRELIARKKRGDKRRDHVEDDYIESPSPTI